METLSLDLVAFETPGCSTFFQNMKHENFEKPEKID